MDKETTFCKITQNDQSFGQCDIDTSANIINNEDKLNLPATYYMSEPTKTNPNGSIAVEETRRLLNTGFYDGAASTLAESRLYSFYKPIQKELFEKEQQYKKLVFDNSSFINRFGKDYMLSKYNLERSKELYQMNKAQQEQDFNAVLEHKYRIEDLNKKLSAYSQPEEGFVNSSANVLASMARNAPEMIGVAVGAGVVTAATGGTGLPAYLATAGATVLEGAIIYNDTYDIEAGDMLENLADKNMTLDQKLAVAEDYANISALIEASGSIFGLAGMGGRALTKGAAKLTGEGLKKAATKEAKKEIIDNIVKKGLGEKLRDPQYLAFIGKKMGEHVMSATGEGAQEVTQSVIQDAFVQAIEDGENPENIDLMKNIWKVLGDNSKTSQYGALFANTALASLFISGGIAAGVKGAQTGYQKLLARSMQGMNAQQISEQIIEMKKNSTAYGKSPKAYGENTQAITEAGNAPEQVTIDANKVLDVLDEAEKKGNTELLEQLKNLKITRENLEKAVEGVGHIKIDFKEFDDVVLDPNNGELFQKIKGDYTFDETTMTAKEVGILVEQMKMKRPELAMAEADPQSVFNTVMNGLSKNKNFTPRQVVHNAVLAQVMANRASTFEGGEIDSRKIAFDLINTKQSLLDKTKGLFMYIGQKAKTTPLSQLSSALDLEKTGTDMEKIRQKTGWFKDPKDNQWKYEISDKDANIDENVLNKMFSNKKKDVTLKDVLKHDKLFKAYPELANVKVNYNSHLKNTRGQVYTEKGKLVIDIKKTSDLKGLKSTLLHEVQHYIQREEGFARGGSPKAYSTPLPDELKNSWKERYDIHKFLWQKLKDNNIKPNSENPSHVAIQDARKFLNEIAKKDEAVKEKLKRLDELDERLKRVDEGDRFMKYLNIPGENEARDTQRRIELTDEERKKITPANLEGSRAPIYTFEIEGEKTDIQTTPRTEDKDLKIAGIFSKEQGQNIIRLTEAVNPTTFVHEFNHLIINDMLESFNGGKMTEYWKKETMKIAKFVGAELKDGKLQFTEEQFEKVAEAFQTYMKEGKAPVDGLQDIFNRMMEWFIDVYKKLTMNDVKLNKSIRSAFDSLLVSKEEMDQAIIDKNLRAIGRRPGMSEAEYQAYLSDLSELNRVSTNKHIEAMRKKARTAIEEKNQKKLAEIKATISAELDNRPDYQFRADVMTRKINGADIPSEYKLKNPGLFTKENGVPLEQFLTDHADVVSNAADVVQLLNNLESKEDIVERESAAQFSEWLNEQYPELAEVDAKIAAANDKLIRVRVKEYMMLHKIPMSQFNQYYNELIRAGEEEIQSMNLRELVNIEKMQDLETKIVTKARFAKNDSELANSMWHQAALNYILMRAKDIRVQVNRFNKHFDKYRYLPNENTIKRIDAYDFDMITGILNNFGFTNKKPRVKDVALTDRLYNWINGKLSGGFTDANLIREYVPTLGQQTETKFDKNNYHNFSVINTVVRFIESASQAEKLQTETDKRLLRETDAQEVVDFQVNKNIDANAHSWWVDNVVMKEQLLKKIFPEKVFINYVLPFIDSMSLREQRIEKNDAALYEALKNTVANRKKVFSIQLASGQLLNMTYEELQVAVLNIDNMETWIASWNAQKNVELNESDFLSMIEQAPQDMITDAQKIWNVFDSQKAEFREAQYKINGFLMDYVEPRKITLSDGREIQSGYFPRGKVPTAEKDFSSMVMSFNNNGMYSIGTDKFAKDRLTKSHKNLDLSINSIRSWLYHSATVIDVGPNYNKLSKLINNETLKQTMSADINKSLNDWMSYAIVGDNLNKFFSTLDMISSVQILGWEPIKAIVQALGFIPSIASVGIQWVAPQFLKMTTYGNMFSVKEVMKLSPYMKERYENAANHIASISESNQLIRSGKELSDKLMNLAMWFTVQGDAFASYIVWNGAYEKALTQGKNENEAILLADSEVRTSQGDSTTVSRPKILQGEKRFLTKFASYFLAINSRISSAVIGKDRLEAVATLMLAGVIGPIAESMMRSLYEWGVGSDDDKDKWRKNKIRTFEDLFYYNAKGNITGSIGQSLVPVLGAGGYAANLLTTGQAFDKPIAMLDYLYNLEKAAVYPIKAAYADTKQEKEKYLKQAKKSALKSLTIPNKIVKMLTD